MADLTTPSIFSFASVNAVEKPARAKRVKQRDRVDRRLTDLAASPDSQDGSQEQGMALSPSSHPSSNVGPTNARPRRQFFTELGVRREIWRPGDGDGDYADDFHGKVNPDPMRRFRFYQGDIGAIILGVNEPPKNVLLDDKAAHRIVESGIYTCEQVGKWWSHDFNVKGNPRATRRNRGRTAYEADGITVASAKQGVKKGAPEKLYYFTGSSTMDIEDADEDDEYAAADEDENFGVFDSIEDGGFFQHQPNSSMLVNNGSANRDRNESEGLFVTPAPPQQKGTRSKAKVSKVAGMRLIYADEDPNAHDYQVSKRPHSDDAASEASDANDSGTNNSGDGTARGPKRQRHLSPTPAVSEGEKFSVRLLAVLPHGPDGPLFIETLGEPMKELCNDIDACEADLRATGKRLVKAKEKNATLNADLCDAVETFGARIEKLEDLLATAAADKEAEIATLKLQLQAVTQEAASEREKGAAERKRLENLRKMMG
ncbi:hypothetical protein BJ546DRAFT_207036 [Cryomyces antarcticus]